MIEAYIYRNKSGEVYGYKVTDHADSHVCNAVSILVLNTVNSIESFTEVDFECDYEEAGGYFWLNISSVKNGEHNHDVSLLLNSLVLGLKTIEMEYEKDIKVYDEEVQLND